MTKKNRNRLLTFLVVVIITNLPPVYTVIHLFEVIDMQHYSYSNSDDLDTTFVEKFGSPYSFRTKVYDDYRLSHPNNDTLMYRNFWKNTLCFWRWKEYYTDRKYTLPYISRSDVEKNALKKQLKH